MSGDGEQAGAEPSDIVRLTDIAPFRLGRVAVDPPALLLTGSDGTTERIQPRMMQVLAMLAAARGSVVGRAAINAACWEGRQVSNDALDRVISRLRGYAVGVGKESFAIETLPRVGFRLVETPAEPLVDEPSADDEVAAPAPAPPAPAPPASTPPAPAPPHPRHSRRALIAGGAAAGLVAVAGGALLLGRRGPASPDDGTSAIVVLPFEADSSDRVARRFALGTARDLRELLARVAGLRVIAAGSSAAADDPTTAARRLHARFVVSGSVETAGDLARVKASLIDAHTGATLAAVQAEGTAAQVFAVQDAVKGPLLREIVGRTGLAEPVPHRSAVVDSRAYQLAVEAQDLVERSRTARMGGRVEEAIDLADRADDTARAALAIAPEYPPALLAIAELVRYGWTRPLAAEPLTAEQRVAASIGYVTRALAADPNDPRALTALGDYYRRYRWRWNEAETLFRKALAINPSLVEAHWSYAYQLGTLGRAVEGLTHAAAVSRLDPGTTWRRLALPRLLYLCGERDAAMAHYHDELRATPTNLFLITELYLMHLTEKDGAAIDRLVATAGAQPMPKPLAALLAKLTQAAAALRGDAAAFLAQVDRDVADFDAGHPGANAGQGRASVDMLYLYAIEYAWAGAPDRAVPLLDRALAAHSLYWPATLPYGPEPFSAAMPAPPLDATWRSTAERREVLARRRAALLARQSAGLLPDGRRLRPFPEAIARALAAASV